MMPKMNDEQAKIVALQALAYLVDEQQVLQRLKKAASYEDKKKAHCAKWEDMRQTDERKSSAS